MWPRRSQAPPAAAASAPSQPPRAVPAAPPAVARGDGDDCGWLMRAVANKKTKNKSKPPAAAKPPSATLVSASAPAPAKAPPSVGWTSGGGGAAAAKASKKRPLLDGKAKPAPPAKLPRGIGWSQPTKTAPKPTPSKPSAAELPTAPPGESFDDVFAEIYGGASKRVQTSAPVELGDDDSPALPLSASLFLPDTTALDNALPAQTTSAEAKLRAPAAVSSSAAARDAGTTWGFKAPSAIELDAFNTVSDAMRSGEDGKQAQSDAAFSRWKDDQSSHAVSDNFVRLNMRKRFKGSSGKAKKQPAYLRSRGFVDAEEKALIQQKADRNADVARPGGGGGGLLDDGIDFIEECLELLKRHEANGAQGSASKTEGDSAVIASSAAPPPDIEPPRCQHALVCQRVLVKKKNKNHGRAFFSCPLGYDEGRCDYFLWEENHTQFALHRLFGEASGDSVDADSTSYEDDPTSKYLPLDLSKAIEKQAKAMLTNLRVVFGHSEFRAGQQWAIQRVFEKKRTLLVLPTGAGKSLCYQYPALFLPGITIVISPLISLMNDQFHNLPPVLKRQATCVTTSSSSKTQYAEFVRDLLGGKLKLLFVSPEKALTSGFQRLLSQMQSRISLVCVDEAHCISEWSHHFRPSYLRLASVFALADSVLAITATASRRVERDILSQLTSATQTDDDADEEGDQALKSVLRMPWQRDNLNLRVVRVRSDEERLERLCTLLTKTAVSGAIIMYVHQQWQAEAMANLLQERLAMDGGSDSSKTKWAKHKIAAYHAKMDAEAKEKVRLGFLSGRVKLVIATIAFGMGIDKQNVRLVVHYHVPSSIEHYLQQVGRAGRDGRAATALLFLLDDDVRAFRSLLFSNALHVSQLRKLVELVTGSCCDNVNREFMRQNMVVVPMSKEQPALRSRTWMHISSLEQHLDMKSAMVETFLTLMSLDTTIQEDMRISIQPTAMSWCVINMMESQLKAPQADPLLKRLVGSVMNNDATSSLGHVEVEVDGYLRHLRVFFHVASAARQLLPVERAGTFGTDMESRMLDVQSRRLMQSVRNWQAQGLVRKFQMERSAFDISIEWVSQQDNQASEAERRRQCVDAWTELLYERHHALESMEIKRLRHLYVALSAAAAPMESSPQIDVDSEAEDNDEAESGAGLLERKLSSYFDESQAVGADDVDDQEALWRSLTSPLTPDLVEAIERDVEVLTSRPPGAVLQAEEDDQHDALSRGIGTTANAFSTEWHGYNVARIFHGLASPCFPSKQWRDQLWWRKYNHVAFEKLVVIADKVVRAASEP